MQRLAVRTAPGGRQRGQRGSCSAHVADEQRDGEQVPGRCL